MCRINNGRAKCIQQTIYSTIVNKNNTEKQMLNPTSEREIRESVENNEYVALSYVRELLDEVERLRRIAYIGEHYFPDSTYKARLEETMRDLREAQAQRDNILDAAADGAWMARALDAERQRDILKDQLQYAESYMSQQLNTVKARADIAERDYASLEYDAARVVIAYLCGDKVELNEAVDLLKSNGRDEWWKKYNEGDHAE